MDYKIAYIRRRKDLKIVLNNKIGQIAITDKKLAKAIYNLKEANIFKFFLAIILLISSISNFYNFIGWLIGVVALKTVGYKILSSIGYLSFFIGFSNLFKMYFKYRISSNLEPEDEVFDDKVFLLLIYMKQ